VVRRATVLTVALFVLAWCPCAFALNPALDVSQYIHTSWKIRDGFTRGTIRSIAQTPDGFLWLGTQLGLLRFDGVRARPWQPTSPHRLPSENIISLLTTRDGTLWIGTDKGLVSWKDGHLVDYQGLAGSYIGRLVEDRDGSIWAARFLNRWTLCGIQKASVTCYGEDGGPGADALGLYEDRGGKLWIGTATGLWRWKPGPPAFHRFPGEANGILGLSEASDGSLLMATAGGIRRFADGEAEMAYPFPPWMQPVQVQTLFRDRNGGLWAGTTSRGLVHVHEGITDVFSDTDGLSGDAVSTIFEDREGSIWVATLDGLDRFRESAAVSYSVKQGLSNSRVMSVLAATDGSIWLGTYDGLNRWTGGQVTVYRERGAPDAIGSRLLSSRQVREITGPGLPTGVQSIFEDSQHRVWLATARGVGYLENDRFVVPEGVHGRVTRAIVEDGHHNLWIANLEGGLFRLPRGSQSAEQTAWSVLKHDDPVSALAADRSGDGLWFGFHRGGVTYFAGGAVRASYGASDGLAAGRVSALHADPAGTLWIATDGGLSRLKNNRVATLTSRNGLPCDAVGWVIEDAARSLWLGMACGLVRIARGELDAWTAATDRGTPADDVGHRVQVTVFDHADGVRLFVNASYYTAPVARASDGKLWFMSQDGVTVIDPAHLPVNTLPPPVLIEQVVADRKTYAVIPESRTPLHLPALIRDLRIDYTALSLVAAEQMQFRYLLEGYDRDWQDAASRRQAFYTNLPPRDYRFRVIAANNSGVWNEVGASIDFVVPPAYYQTRWFLALSVGVVVGLVWAAHRIRVRVVERHQREITALNERMMKAQEQERIRIAGELHDGVMQQMLAVTMMLGTAKRRISGDSDAKAMIDKVQQKLIEAGTEIRQLSHDLHPPALQDAGLPEAVNAYCEEFSTASGIPVACDADERASELSRGASLALFRILQEALGNAAKHARAKRITVGLTRKEGLVALTVSDDGAGFDPGRLATSGGLGLIMMRERASQLNGRFEFESAPNQGTTIRVVVPFR
jgi:signal transduction histidine kinase/ligand-binding sensor domain-containing protein